MSFPFRSSLLLFLLASTHPSLAQAGTPMILEAQATDGAKARVELRDEYIHDEPMLIPISLVNPGSERIEIPDLATRPWLVEFHLVLPTGNDQVRKNATPDEDPGTRLSVTPRGQRMVLLEVPASSSLKAGEYSMEVWIRLPGETLVLPKVKLSILPAQPLAVDLSPQQHPASQTEPLPSLWLHKGLNGNDLYLHQSNGKYPTRMISDIFLFSSASVIEPTLSASRARETSSGHVVWQDGPRAVQILRLERSSTPGAPTKLELPWPRIQLVARGITSSKGELHLPMWVPAPRGAGGTMQIVRINERGEPVFERLGHFEEQPELSLSMIDDAGRPHLLLVHSGNLDRYSPRLENPSGQKLPVPGTRLMRSRVDHTVIDLQVVALPDSSNRTGALALLLTSLHEQQLHHRWISLTGSLLQEQSTPIGEQQVLAVVANGWGPPGLATRTAVGETVLIDQGRSYPLSLPAKGDWQLYRSHDGTIHQRQAGQSQTNGGPIRNLRVSP
jgi:hypothetical protein